MDRYEFVEQNHHKVAVENRLKDYNHLTTDVWDYLEDAGFQFHGTVRSWSAVFSRSSYYVLHHFIDDQPQEDCIAADSGLTWDMIIERDTDAGELFSFLEKIEYFGPTGPLG